MRIPDGLHAFMTAAPDSRTLGLLLLGLAVRMVLDVLWWVPDLAGGINAMQVGSVLCMLSFAGSLTRTRGWRTPELVTFALLAGALTPRMSDRGAVAVALSIASMALVFAVARQAEVGRHIPRFERTVISVSTAIAALSLLAAIRWPDSWELLHGTWRLRGIYLNIHNHSLVMAFAASMAIYRAVDGDRRAWLALALLMPALYLTYSRSSWLLLAVSSLGLARTRRARAGLLGATLLAAGVIALDPSARGRVIHTAQLLFSGHPDAMLELGTGRVRMWVSSMAAFGDQSPWAWFFGAGIGGSHEFWKPKHPASELLYLLYTFGLLGVTLALSALVAAAREASESTDPRRAQVLATLGAAVLTGLVTDSIVARMTPSWLFMVWLAAAFTLPRTRPSPMD